LGLVLPFGLASDHGSASLRRAVLSQSAVDELVGFENRKAIFPIHRSVRFLLLTATKGTPTAELTCRLGRQDLSALDDDGRMGPAEKESHGAIRLTPALLTKLSGEDLGIPNLCSPLDLTIVERAATLFAPLGRPDGWGAQFGRELNATDDRRHFQPPGRGLPVVEGKMLEPFRVRLKHAQHAIAPDAAADLLAGRERKPRLAYRDVASATNRLTLIAALLPAHSVSTHTLFCLRTSLPANEQRYLCGLFNSLLVNYLVRLRVTTHVTTAIVEQLPIPTKEQAGSRWIEIARLTAMLSHRPDLAALARLNARVAQLYQLNEREFAHVVDTFPLVDGDMREGAMNEFRRLVDLG
jgi:hypothetical protein